MNGRFSPPAEPFRRAGICQARRRLIAAVIVSCILHVLLLAAAYLGASNRESPIVAAQGHTPAGPFNASLKPPAPLKPEIPLESALPVASREGIGVLPFSAPPFYPTNQLSKRPQPLGSADLDTPEINLIVASGRMILKLWIDETGEVVDVEVESTELPEVFSRSAVAAFKHLRFTPGERGGVRVGSVMRIEVSYDDGRIAAP